MPLLERVEYQEDEGLLGVTEEGKKVILQDPLPCVFVFHHGNAYEEIESLKNKARNDTIRFYQLAGFESTQAVTSTLRVLPYIAYMRVE